MMQVIETIELFPVLNGQLISLLQGLTADDWQKQTVAKKWLVKDVAAHLLDGNFRRIAINRDKWVIPAGRQINSYDELVQFLNELNADWVKAAKRLSPQIIVELLAQTNEAVYRIFKLLAPFEKATFPVSWAGEEESKNWFDIAREYTERWLHQQQIREAIGDKTLFTKQLYYPFLNIFMQAWPHTCRNLVASEGTALKTTITGEGGGDWYLQKQNDSWQISAAVPAIQAATTIDGNIAWKLFSKSVRKDEVKEFITVSGDRKLGEKVLDMISVMA